ncbi:MAG: cytochrome C biogenesis protein CcdA [Desulfobulbus propionicus]|nr:MAG: cytochrome C biogenesis protein CcdA [Desulfobulbus propionicus]
MSTSSYIQVQTTLADEESARRIASEIVSRRLAACVQVTVCHSIYHWQGKIEHDDEFLCVMKTRTDFFPELCRAIEELHPYEVAEIIALPLVNGSERYLRWIDKELRQKQA